MELVRVLVADDEPTRLQARRLLETDGRFEVVGEAADAAGAVAGVVERRPDLVLLAVRLRGSGLAALWEIVSRVPDTRVVMLAASDEPADLFSALRAGASGYLLKNIDPARLADALHDVVRGTPAVSGEFVAHMMEEFRVADPRRRAVSSLDEARQRLTSREWQVLDLLARDRSTGEIAERLVLSPSAVRAHITSIVRKLDVGDRAEAVARFRGSA